MGRQKTTVAEAISKLQEKLDVDIVLLFETGLTYQAVAERFGCSISRVQEVLRRAHTFWFRAAFWFQARVCVTISPSSLARIVAWSINSASSSPRNWTTRSIS